MTNQHPVDDALVLGGGFYGAVIAQYLVLERGLKRVTILEQDEGLCLRASQNNQARVHNGYHYPRDITTALRSRMNMPEFVKDWKDSVVGTFESIYAIARSRSKVTPRQFVRFCAEISAEVRPASDKIVRLFDTSLVAEVFSVREYAFDVANLREQLYRRLHHAGITVEFETKALRVEADRRGRLITQAVAGSKFKTFESRYLFNCTYSGLNQVENLRTSSALKHEIAEMALVSVPETFKNLAITVMDGPFFP